MALHPTQIFEALEKLAQESDHSGFIYEFLRIYDTPKNTITKLKKGDAAINVAENVDCGAIALKQRLYFQPVGGGATDVAAALEQLRQSPAIAKHKIRFLIATDYREVAAYDARVDDVLECDFSELYKNYAFFLPLAGYEKSQAFSENPADTKAAEKMGRLSDQIRSLNPDVSPQAVHALNIFLTRLLFCFFAEDTGIFPKSSFTQTLASLTEKSGNDTADYLTRLFRILNLPEHHPDRQQAAAHLAAFPYVNGGLFADDYPMPQFDARARRLLLECGRLDWADINPDIFGSMFQAVIDPVQRSRLGQHYTSVPNIMKAIQPLFLDALQTAFEQILANRQTRNDTKIQKLHALNMRLACIKIFDPACGSGNFLIIAYKELRRLEIRIFQAIRELGGNDYFVSQIHLGRFYGIEIDDFAAETAKLSLWLAEHQMNSAHQLQLGNALPTLPLKDSGHILAANSLRQDWESFCPRDSRRDDEVYLVGNPPFGGKQYRNAEQKTDMKQVFSEFKNSSILDYVACWFWKGAEYIRSSRAKLALVATNSITQGEQVAMLWPPIFALNVHIAFAYQTFPWVNNARQKAAVHVVIIGLAAEPEQENAHGGLQSGFAFGADGGNEELDFEAAETVPRRLFRPSEKEWVVQEVANISPYLHDMSNTTIKSRMKPLCDVREMVFGNMPNDGGFLLLDTTEKEHLLTAEPKAKKWIKKLLGSDEFLNGKERWCLWLVDITSEELAAMPLVEERVKNVQKKRAESRRAETKELAATPHLFAEIRQPSDGQYILVPRVSSERRQYVPMDFLNADVITTDRNQMIPNGSYYEFGILNSMMHNDWMRTVTGRLESRFNYSGTIVYNTFPWPEASENEREQISDLAKNILRARAVNVGKTLAQLYDPDNMPDNLRQAHQALDAAVDKLYRAKPFSDGLERVAHLFGLYEQLIAAEQQREAASKMGRRKKKAV